MKCTNCNKKIDEDSKFCEYCGTPVYLSQKEPNQPIPNENAPETIEKLSKYENSPHPWLRYFARMIDYGSFAISIVILGGIILYFYPAFQKPYNEIFVKSSVWPFLSFFSWAFIESLFLSKFGSTPGKFLLGIKVLNKQGNKLSYGQALTRSLNVYIKGVGLGLPIISLVTLIVGHNNLKKNGTTSWDQSSGAEVWHRGIGLIRFSFLVIIGILIGGLYYYGFSEEQKDNLAQKQFEKENWTEIHSPEFGFAISFPTEPSKTVDEGDFNEGVKYKETIWVSEVGNDKAYALDVLQLSSPVIEDPKKFLESFSNLMAQEENKKIISSKFTKFNDLLAIDFIIKDEKVGAYTHQKAFVPDRSKMVIIRGVSYSETPPEKFEKFYSSFRSFK